MDIQYIQEFLLALLREIVRKRFLAVLIFSICSLAILVVGISWPLTYRTQATLYVDQRNIIQPLLEGQAEVQSVNQTREARDKIYTRAILEKVARDAGLVDQDSDSKQLASALASLGNGTGNSGIQIRSSGPNYLRISYNNSDPEVSFNVVTALINAFIRNIAETKRQGSKEAFEFIERQVETYKEQLKTADDRLKEFNAQNKDGN